MCYYLSPSPKESTLDEPLINAFGGLVLLFYQLAPYWIGSQGHSGCFLKHCLHCLWHLLISLLSPFLSFCHLPVLRLLRAYGNLPCESTSDFILLEKGPCSGTLLPSFHFPSEFSYLTTSPRIQWNNSLDVEFDISRGGIWV